MTARDRVIAALSHTQPDRIPRYEIFRPEYIDAWRKAKGVGSEADIYDHYRKVDIGAVLAVQEGPFVSRARTEETGTDIYFVNDSWGRRRRCSHNGAFFEVLETAVAGKAALDTLQFEDPWDEGRRTALREAEARVHDRFAPVSGVMGLFMGSYFLRGELQLLIDLKEDAAFCRSLAHTVARFLTPVGEKALSCTDTWDTAIWVYDELANNDSPLISPKTFESVYLEPYKRMISRWKSRGAKNVILHCDGNCLGLADLLLEAGFNGIQGVIPATGMTVPALKAKYGSRLSLIGGMCNIHVLTRGSRAEIQRQAQSVVEVARDGGVIIGTHCIGGDVPVESYDYYCAVLDQLDEAW